MKNIILVLIILLLGQNGIAQRYYETSWSSNGVKYTGLLIYYDDDDATMRVKYKINDNYKVAEFKCYGEYFEQNGLNGYLLDGRSAKVVYGNNGTGYSADNFIFVKNGNNYSTPTHIDDNGLEQDSPKDYLIEVDYWNEISTDKFTESYVYGFFEKTEPLYATLLSYNSQNNQENEPSTHYRISSLSHGNGQWAITMSKGTGYSSQSWKTNSTYPKDWIKEKWDDDFRITSVAYGGGEWAVSMSQGSGYTRQSWNTKTYFPKDWIKEKWDDSYRITSVAYGNGEWAIAMSQNSGYTMQSWNAKTYFPKDWIKEKWDDSYRITSVAYGAGQWAVAMSQSSGYTMQTYKLSSNYPKDWIKEKWNDDYDITSIAYGGGEWSIVMSKESGFSTQSWKTSSSYPKDWIKEKWDEEIYVQDDEPELVENVTLHLILVTNTLIGDIGASCKVDKNNTFNEFQTICDELEIPFRKSIISEREFSKESVRSALNNLQPKSNDIVVFVYSGHGYRWSNQNYKYPNLDLRYSNYQSISENTTYNLSEVYKIITNKGARLNLIIGDCCNSDIGVSNRGGEPSLVTRRYSQGKIDKLRTLFLESKGNLIVAAAKPYETSCGNSRDGGYFISSFLAAISKETSRLNYNYPDWENIVSSSINTANYKTQNLRGCDPQNGIYYSTIKRQ